MNSKIIKNDDNSDVEKIFSLLQKVEFHSMDDDWEFLEGIEDVMAPYSRYEQERILLKVLSKNQKLKKLHRKRKKGQ